jgi:hypothetical protein
VKHEDRGAVEEMVELEGVAPSSPTCRAGTLLLSYSPVTGMVEPEGIAPSSLACRTSILLLNYGSISCRGDRDCTCDLTVPNRALCS